MYIGMCICHRLFRGISHGISYGYCRRHSTRHTMTLPSRGITRGEKTMVLSIEQKGGQIIIHDMTATKEYSTCTEGTKFHGRMQHLLVRGYPMSKHYLRLTDSKNKYCG